MAALAGRKGTFRYECSVLNIFLCILYTAGCQLDRVQSAQRMVSEREGELHKDVYTFCLWVTCIGGTEMQWNKTWSCFYPSFTSMLKDTCLIL